jgi:hypothetical protein
VRKLMWHRAKCRQASSRPGAERVSVSVPGVRWREDLNDAFEQLDRVPPAIYGLASPSPCCRATESSIRESVT